MPKIKKLGADAVQAAAMGHNSLTKDMYAKFLKRDANIVDQIAALTKTVRQTCVTLRTPVCLKSQYGKLRKSPV